MATAYWKQPKQYFVNTERGRRGGSTDETTTPGDDGSETDSESFEDDKAEQYTSESSDKVNDVVYPDEDEDIGFTVSEGESDFDTRIANEEYPSLMRFLFKDTSNYGNEGQHNEDSELSDITPSDLNDHDEEEDEDSSIEDEEEQAIVREFELSSPTASDAGQDHQLDGDGREDDEEEEIEDDDEDDDDDEESLSDVDLLDFFEPTTPRSLSRRRTNQTSPRGAYDTENGNDDSYLWGYFLSSDGENDDGRGERAGFGHGDASDEQAIIEPQHSGDSTDEELDLPPPSKRARGGRAVEVLSANSFSTRPPVLGSWSVENGRHNFGIIDGLTTRSLSPPMNPQLYQTPLRRGGSGAVGKGQSSVGAGADETGLDDGYAWLNEEDEEENVDISDVALDEFINTDELEGGDSDDELAPSETNADSPFMQRSRFNKNVPMFAFRNKSSPYHYPYAYDGAPPRRVRRRSGVSGREAIMPALKLHRRRGKKVRGGVAKHHVDYAHRDLLEELLEAGAVTPLFEV